jgi:hypothetical protein
MDSNVVLPKDISDINEVKEEEESSIEIVNTE